MPPFLAPSLRSPEYSSKPHPKLPLQDFLVVEPIVHYWADGAALAFQVDPPVGHIDCIDHTDRSKDSAGRADKDTAVDQPAAETAVVAAAFAVAEESVQVEIYLACIEEGAGSALG